MGQANNSMEQRGFVWGGVKLVIYRARRKDDGQMTTWDGRVKVDRK